MVLDVEVRVVERAAEERHRIVAAGAPARGLHVAVALQRHLAGLLHAEQVGRVVERAEVVRAVEPALVARPDGTSGSTSSIISVRAGMKLPVAVRAARRLEVLLALRRPDHVPLARILRVQTPPCPPRPRPPRRPRPDPDLPLDPRARPGGAARTARPRTAASPRAPSRRPTAAAGSCSSKPSTRIRTTPESSTTRLTANSR